jgi:hypothetical protein
VDRPHAVLAFDGGSDYVKLDTAKALGLTNASFTVECWVNVAHFETDLSVLGTDHPVTNEGLHLVIREKKAYMGFYGDDLAGKTRLPANQWVHLAWRFDAATKEQAIFVDGKQDATRTAKSYFLGEDLVYLGRSLETHLFRGMISDLRIWNTPRTQAEIVHNMRSYRASFAIRGPVDGSATPEYLFHVPSEGGLQLVSRFSTAHEKRLIAYHDRKAAQAKAARDVASAHTDYHGQVSAKNEELRKTHLEKGAEIDAKKAAHKQERLTNRLHLNQKKTESQRKIGKAKRDAARKRQDAESQAAATRGKAHSDAESMKRKARANRDAAKRERNKY